MHTQNPYTQGGWVGSSTSSPDFPSLPPSIVGALPSTEPTLESGFVTFIFASFQFNILNSIVVRPTQSYIDIVTNTGSPEVTSFRNCEGRFLSKIEWYQRPVVDIPGTVPRQLASRFLELSPDGSFRIVRFDGKNYAWIQRPESDSIYLYNISYNPAEVKARIIQARDSVNLQMTSSAIHEGLMEICLVSTVLLLSGRQVE